MADTTKTFSNEVKKNAMPFKKIFVVTGLLVLIVAVGYALFPNQYPTFFTPKLNAKEQQARCAEHTSDEECRTDIYCHGVEMTPVCIETETGQQCLNGGYACAANSEYAKP